MMPTAEEKEEMRERKAMRKSGKGRDQDDASSDNATPTTDKVVFEMIPPSKQHVLQQQQQGQGQGQGQGQSPFTPRTQAFHTLERKLPLRGY